MDELSETTVITLLVVGSKKIQVIKSVRGMTNLGLRESKDIVDWADKVDQTSTFAAIGSLTTQQIEDEFPNDVQWFFGQDGHKGNKDFTDLTNPDTVEYWKRLCDEKSRKVADLTYQHGLQETKYMTLEKKLEIQKFTYNCVVYAGGVDQAIDMLACLGKNVNSNDFADALRILKEEND